MGRGTVRVFAEPAGVVVDAQPVFFVVVQPAADPRFGEEAIAFPRAVPLLATDQGDMPLRERLRGLTYRLFLHVAGERVIRMGLADDQAAVAADVPFVFDLPLAQRLQVQALRQLRAWRGGLHFLDLFLHEEGGRLLGDLMQFCLAQLQCFGRRSGGGRGGRCAAELAQRPCGGDNHPARIDLDPPHALAEILDFLLLDRRSLDQPAVFFHHLAAGGLATAEQRIQPCGGQGRAERHGRQRTRAA